MLVVYSPAIAGRPQHGVDPAASQLTALCFSQNSGLATLLARLEGIFGPVPEWMRGHGRYAHRFYTRAGALYRHSPRTVRLAPLLPPEQRAVSSTAPA